MLKKNLIRSPEEDEQMEIKEDLNNNDPISKVDDEKRKDLKRSVKLSKASSCESNCSNLTSTDKPKFTTINPQATSNQKSSNKKKTFTLNGNSVKQLQRSCSEKTNDNTAKQVFFIQTSFERCFETSLF